MAKQPSARKRSTNSGGTARRRKPTKTAKTATARTSAIRKPATRRKPAAKKKAKVSAKHPVTAEAISQSYLEALGAYEQALDALQRRDLADAAKRFQQVIDLFPEERELHERSRLYLRVCERESKPPPVPETVEEQILAATLALNAGAHDQALQLLETAMKQDPDSGDVQYMLAVALAANGNTTAVGHLQRAVELNPDNRFLARQEPSFQPLQEDEAFQRALQVPPTPPARRVRNRSSK